MKRAIQSLAQVLLAVCCLAGCSRNEPISSANLPRTTDVCVVEAKQAVLFYEYEKAVKLCDEALRISPDHIGALLTRGDVWGRLAMCVDPRIVPNRPKVEEENAHRDYTRARTIATKGSSLEAIAAVHCGIGTRMLLGREIGEQELQEAIKHCDAVIAQRPDDVDCLAARSFAIWDLSNPTEFSDSSPEFADLARAIELAPERLVFREKLFTYYKYAGDFEEATKVADEIARRFPDHPNGFSLRCECLELKGEFIQALEAANKAAARMKSKPLAFQRNLAKTLARAGKLEKAIEIQLDVATARPDDAENHFLLAQFYADVGNFREALKSTKEFERRAPGASSDAMSLVRMIEKRTTLNQLDKWSNGGPYNRWSEPTPQQAMANVAHRLQTEPPNARLFIDCGVEYYRVNDFEEALSCFSRAIALEPQNAEAHGRRGVTFNHLQQKAKAREDFLKACRLDVDTHSRR